jgi:peptide-methionine (R)-S-oxide reductase
MGELISNEKPDGNKYPVQKTDQEWKSELSDFEYHVLRQAGTEPAWSGEIEKGENLTYVCRGCNSKLFTSNEKFDSRCGWPSFWSPLAKEAIIELPDYSMGRLRVEVRCANCGSHLGHVFEGEGFDTPSDLRYCINAVCLKSAD